MIFASPVDLRRGKELAEIGLACWAGLEVAADPHVASGAGGGNVCDTLKLLVQAATAEVVACKGALSVTKIGCLPKLIPGLTAGRSQRVAQNTLAGLTLELLEGLLVLG